LDPIWRSNGRDIPKHDSWAMYNQTKKPIPSLKTGGPCLARPIKNAEPQVTFEHSPSCQAWEISASSAPTPPASGQLTFPRSRFPLPKVLDCQLPGSAIRVTFRLTHGAEISLPAFACWLVTSRPSPRELTHQSLKVLHTYYSTFCPTCQGFLCAKRSRASGRGRRPTRYGSASRPALPQIVV